MSKLAEVGNLVHYLLENDEQPILVVSAFKGVTNALLAALDELHEKADYTEEDISAAFQPVMEIIYKVCPEQALAFVDQQFQAVIQSLLDHKSTKAGLFPGEKTYQIRDKVIQLGEQTAAGVLQYFLEEQGVEAKAVFDVEAEPSSHVSNRILHHKIQGGLAKHFQQISPEDRKKVLIFGGHVAGTPRGIIEDVGRSYSDTTAVDLAIAVSSLATDTAARIHEVIYWKDVDGLMSGNPNELDPETNHPQLITDVLFNEALELASAGSLLLQPEALVLAEREGIRLRVKNILHPRHPGTSFDSTEIITASPFKAVCTQPCDLIRFECPAMATQSGFLERLSAAFSKHRVNVSDPLSAGAKISFAIPLPSDESAIQRLRQSLREICREFRNIVIDGEEYDIDVGWDQGTYANVCVIGKELANQTGILSEITGVLAAHNINIYGITHETSQIKISIYVHENYRKLAAQVLHAYFIDKDPRIQDFVAKRRAELSQRYVKS